MSYGGGRGRSYGGGGGSRDYNRSSLNPTPVEAKKEYEVDITEISRQGDGIARVQGFVVFVKNGKVGNKVKVKVTELADRFSKAIIAG
jgi:predicted RNA-binding protein with TRAM domain